MHMGQDVTAWMQAISSLDRLTAWEPHSSLHFIALTKYSKETIADWQPRFFFLRDILLIVWVIDAFDWIFLRGSLKRLCLPRRTIGLFAIPLIPLVHGDIEHLAWNSLGFFFLGWLILLRGVPDFLAVTAISGLIGGLGIWMFGRGGVPTIGASGIVYGYFGFLLFTSFFERDVISFILTVAAGLMYGWMLKSLLSQRPGVSSEGHISGFFGGILAAIWLPTI